MKRIAGSLILVIVVFVAAWGQAGPTPTPTEQIATLKAQLATAQAQVELFRGKWLAAQAQVFARAAQDAEVSSKAACGPDYMQQQDQNGLPVCAPKPVEAAKPPGIQPPPPYSTKDTEQPKK